jgi:hypothetical protein
MMTLSMAREEGCKIPPQLLKPLESHGVLSIS